MWQHTGETNVYRILVGKSERDNFEDLPWSWWEVMNMAANRVDVNRVHLMWNAGSCERGNEFSGSTDMGNVFTI